MNAEFSSTRLVSCIVPSFGRPVYLRRALSSIEAQSWIKLEVVVVDDNGRDTENQKLTRSVVDLFRSKLDIQYLINETNLGGAGSRNSGVSRSKGEYLAFLDDDDEWMPDFLSNSVQLLENSDALVAYCDCYVEREDKPNHRKLEVNQKYRGIVRDHLLSGWCPSSTSLFVLKRETIEKSKNTVLFDEKLSSFQDYDCWLSLSELCIFDFHCEPMVIKHRHSGGQITTNTKARRDALGVLSAKWIPRLDKADLMEFKNTLRHLEGGILKMEYDLSFRKRQVGKSTSKAWRYLRINSFSPRAFIELSKTTVNAL